MKLSENRPLACGVLALVIAVSRLRAKVEAAVATVMEAPTLPALATTRLGNIEQAHRKTRKMAAALWHRKATMSGAPEMPFAPTPFTVRLARSQARLVRCCFSGASVMIDFVLA